MGSIGTSDVYKPLNDYEHPISIEAVSAGVGLLLEPHNYADALFPN
jgi:hypothetical protein